MHSKKLFWCLSIIIPVVCITTLWWSTSINASNHVTCSSHQRLNVHTNYEFSTNGNIQCFNISRQAKDYNLVLTFTAKQERYQLYWIPGFNQQKIERSPIPLIFDSSSPAQPLGLPAFGGGNRYTLAVVPLDSRSNGGFSLWIDEQEVSLAEADSDDSGTGGIGSIPAAGQLFTIGAKSRAVFAFDATCNGLITVSAFWYAPTIPMNVQLMAPSGEIVKQADGADVKLSHRIRREDLRRAVVNNSGPAGSGNYRLEPAEGSWYVFIYNPSPDIDLPVASLNIKHPAANCPVRCVELLNNQWQSCRINIGDSALPGLQHAATILPLLLDEQNKGTATPTKTPTRRPTATPTATRTLTQPGGTSQRGRVTINNLRIRSGPGTSHSIVGGLNRNDFVEISDRSGDGQWYQLSNGNWVFANYIVILENTSNPIRQIVFRQGYSPNSSYSGAADTTIEEQRPIQGHGTWTECYVDGDDPPDSDQDRVALLYWDISAIPAGSRINSAWITLEVINRTNNTYFAYQMRRNWSESQATWYSYRNNQSWTRGGASGASDRVTDTIGSIGPVEAGEETLKLNARGIAMLQGWVDGTIQNYGIGIANSSATDGLDFHCSESSSQHLRPALTVNYTQ